jgi:hypothetical protein
MTLQSLVEYERKEYDSDFTRYIADLRIQSVRDVIAKNIQPAKVYNNIFDQEELDWIRGYAFTCCRSVKHNNDGTIFLHGNLDGVYEKFADKINKILPGAENSPIVGGNIYITQHPYGLHNDSTRFLDWENGLEKYPTDHNERRWVPWRNVIIPIMVTPENTPSHAVFFKQRHIDFACLFHHGHAGTMPAQYPIARDYDLLEFYDSNGQKIDKQLNSISYDQEHYEKYLSYTPKRRLTGMVPELTCRWHPGDAMVFDAVQLHATNKGTKCTWLTKMGLLLTFLKEIPK